MGGSNIHTHTHTHTQVGQACLSRPMPKVGSVAVDIPDGDKFSSLNDRSTTLSMKGKRASSGMFSS